MSVPGHHDPQNDFDGLLGFAKLGFLKVSFDFKKWAVRVGVTNRLSSGESEELIIMNETKF
jgi:hypothetical protein